MTGTPPSSPRVALAERVAELNDMVLFGELDDDEAARMADAIGALVADVPDRPAWWHADAPELAYRTRSPFSGEENPRSPGLRIERLPGTEASMRGRIELDKAFAGPPSAVHGGVLAGLLDELVGAVAGAMASDRVVVTARLTVKYRKPTPLRTPLILEAWPERRSTRRLVIGAECRAGAVRTATAEALMVIA